MNISNPAASGSMVQCPNCGNPFSAQVEQLIDVGQDPSAKTRFLSGQSQTVQCPNCQHAIQVQSPVAYHDPSKELLMVHIPMELGLGNDEQERIVGEMARAITDSLPMEQRKGYLLTPKRAFTLKGMIESILEADGITKDVLEAREAKVNLIQQILTSQPDARETLVAENDEQIDEEFFQMMAVMVQSAVGSGQQNEAQAIAMIREEILEQSSYGKEMMERMQRQEAMVEEVAEDLQELGQAASRQTLLDLMIDYGDDEDRIETLVGLVRQAIDQEFFEILSKRIEDTTSKEKRQHLRDLRDYLLELTERFDQQRQAQVQQATAIIQELINQPDMNAAVDQYMPAINDLVMAVLEANINAMEQQGNLETAKRLQELYVIIQQKFAQSAPPEVQFINQLISAENEMDARLLLMDHAHEYSDTLLQYMDALIEDLTARGAQGLVEQLQSLRAETERVLAEEN